MRALVVAGNQNGLAGTSCILYISFHVFYIFCGIKMNIKVTFAVINTTWTEVKIRPEKKKNPDFHIFTVIYISLHGFIMSHHSDQLPVGLLSQLVEHCACIAEIMSLSLVQAWIFFKPLSLQLNWCALLERSPWYTFRNQQLTSMIFTDSKLFIGMSEEQNLCLSFCL